MPSYNYPADGKLHTRFSELQHCYNLQSAKKLARYKLFDEPQVRTAYMDFGNIRHTMFSDESNLTGYTPDIFKQELGFSRQVAVVEQHLATELYKGIVIHFTADVITVEPHLVDYKTATGNGNKYANSMQLYLYALLARAHGYNITQGHYLIEQWDRERTQITGYYHVPQIITLGRLAEAKAWAKERGELLVQAMKLTIAEYC